MSSGTPFAFIDQVLLDMMPQPLLLDIWAVFSGNEQQILIQGTCLNMLEPLKTMTERNDTRVSCFWY